ncbi:MAG TPA: hypothetical protein VNF29_03780 [Candidatus Binataceae bacterium]|nr:hypothetical protein [Candidatus Binataceae bacterium]
MTKSAIAHAAAKLVIAAAALAMASCWYYSRPAGGAPGTNCQKSSYGLLMLDTSNENCQPSAAPTAAAPTVTAPPSAPAPE